MKRDSTVQTLLVAAMLCVVCSVIVAGAAVGLRPLQDANKRLDKKKNVLIAGGLIAEGQSVSQQEIDQTFTQKIHPVLIDLKTGQPADSTVVNPETYDQRAAAADPKQNQPIPRSADLAGIKRREKYAFVYEVVDTGGEVQQLVLPINGKGLWSTLYGFLALDADGSTVRGITFYEHGETAGLGAEVDNPKWKAIWPGKQVFDETGKIRLEVIKGSVPPSSPNVQYEVDGISGATITSKGVSNLIHYWLGPDAFGPFLDLLHLHSADTSGQIIGGNNTEDAVPSDPGASLSTPRVDSPDTERTVDPSPTEAPIPAPPAPKPTAPTPPSAAEKQAQLVLAEARLYEAKPGVWYLKQVNHFSTRIYRKLSKDGEVLAALRTLGGELPPRQDWDKRP